MFYLFAFIVESWKKYTKVQTSGPWCWCSVRIYIFVLKYKYSLYLNDYIDNLGRQYYHCIQINYYNAVNC